MTPHRFRTAVERADMSAAVALLADDGPALEAAGIRQR